MTHFPFIDMAKGGSIQGVLAGLNRMVEMASPEFRSEGGTLFIPAHGRVGDIADMTYYRDMTTIIRDRIQDLMKKGTDARAGQGGTPDRRLGSAGSVRTSRGRRTCSSRRSTRACRTRKSSGQGGLRE